METPPLHYFFNHLSQKSHISLKTIMLSKIYLLISCESLERKYLSIMEYWTFLFLRSMAHKSSNDEIWTWVYGLFITINMWKMWHRNMNIEFHLVTISVENTLLYYLTTLKQFIWVFYYILISTVHESLVTMQCVFCYLKQ